MPPKLVKGQCYILTERFAQQYGGFVGKEVLYEGIVTVDASDPRDGRGTKKVHSFAVCNSPEKIRCPSDTSMSYLARMFRPLKSE